MLSVAPLSQGPGYYLELANINYYAEGGEPLPLWHGTAAREFGLSGIAQREHVERLCSGYHHETQDSLGAVLGEAADLERARNQGRAGKAFVAAGEQGLAATELAVVAKAGEIVALVLAKRGAGGAVAHRASRTGERIRSHTSALTPATRARYSPLPPFRA